MDKVCRDFMHNRCTRVNCRFIHDPEVCFHFWKHKNCRNGEQCPKKHYMVMPQQRERQRHRKPKNTETFEPSHEPPAMRITISNSHQSLDIPVQTRDVTLAPNIFSDFAPGEIYAKLMGEVDSCRVPEERLWKSWHGDTHWIADDHTHWKQDCPTFQLIVDRIRDYFHMDVKATRFNWYGDTSEWKPFHHDAAAVKPDKAATQNFTVAVSFGATRDAAFEEVKSKTVISMPQPDGWAYCFARDINILWKHGILQEKTVRQEGRISVIAWGWIHQTEVEGADSLPTVLDNSY